MKVVQGFLGMICICMCFVLMTACFGTHTTKVGLLVDLSGKSSSLGIPARDAAILRINAYNARAKAGQEIKLIIKDTKGDAKEARAKVQEFVEEEVDYIIGPFTSGETTEIDEYFFDR